MQATEITPSHAWCWFLNQWVLSLVSAWCLSSGEKAGKKSRKAAAEPRSAGFCNTGCRGRRRAWCWEKLNFDIYSLTPRFFFLIARLSETIILFPLFFRIPAPKSLFRLSSSGMNSFPEKSQRQSSQITFLLLLKSQSTWLSPAHCCQPLFSLFPSASLCPTISHATGRELKGNKDSCFEEPHRDPLDLKHALCLGDMKDPGLYGTPGMLAQPPPVPLVSKSRWRGVGPVTISAVLLVQRRIRTPTAVLS